MVRPDQNQKSIHARLRQAIIVVGKFLNEVELADSSVLQSMIIHMVHGLDWGSACNLDKLCI